MTQGTDSESTDVILREQWSPLHEDSGDIDTPPSSPLDTRMFLRRATAARPFINDSGDVCVCPPWAGGPGGGRHARGWKTNDHWDPRLLEQHPFCSGLSHSGLYLPPKCQSRSAGCLLSSDLSFFQILVPSLKEPPATALLTSRLCENLMPMLCSQSFVCVVASLCKSYGCRGSGS